MSKNVFGAVVLSSFAVASGKLLVENVSEFNNSRKVVNKAKECLKDEDNNYTIDVKNYWFNYTTRNTTETLKEAKKSRNSHAVDVVCGVFLTGVLVVGAVACLTDKE